MQLALLITAAGSSSRFGSDSKKEFLPLTVNDKELSVLAASTEAFLNTGLFSSCVITIPAHMEDQARKALLYSPRAAYMLQNPEAYIKFNFTSGGASRQESVYAGLQKLSRMCVDSVPDAVLIHDGARPWVTEQIIRDVIDKMHISGAAVPGINVTDTQKQIDDNGKITAHLQRRYLCAVQTPQAFLFLQLLEAHKKAHSDNCEYTDDAEIWGRYCGDVYISTGDRENRKITYKTDL